MLKRKFGNSGPYIYKGKQIDMYALSVWIGRHNRENQISLVPSQVTEQHIELFLADVEEAEREESNRQLSNELFLANKVNNND